MPSIKLRAFLLSSLLIYGQIAKVEKFINQLPNGRECYYQHSVLAAGVGEGNENSAQQLAKIYSIFSTMYVLLLYVFFGGI